MHYRERSPVRRRVSERNRRRLVVVFQDRGVALQFVNEWQLHAVAFELDGHAHLPAGISPRNVFAPATYTARRIAGSCFSDCGLRLLGQGQTLTPEEKVGFVEQPVTSRPPEWPLLPFRARRSFLSASVTSGRLQSSASAGRGRSGWPFLRPRPAHPEHKWKIVPSRCVRTTRSWNALAPIRKAGNAFEYRGFPQRDGAYSNGPKIPDCGLKPEFHLFRGFTACHSTGAY